MAKLVLTENYTSTLEKICLERYKQKISLINWTDPYNIDTSWFIEDPAHLPQIEYPDIVNYCVFTKNAYTMAEFKSYKSLDAFNQFTSGWVSELASTEINERIVVRSKVCSYFLRIRVFLPIHFQASVEQSKKNLANQFCKPTWQPPPLPFKLV